MPETIKKPRTSLWRGQSNTFVVVIIEEKRGKKDKLEFSVK